MKTLILALILSSSVYSAQTNHRIVSGKSATTIHVSPSNEVILGKHSEMSLLQDFVELVKGKAHFAVKAEMKVQAPEVSFTTSAAEFDVVITQDSVDLHVLTGQVEASSPHIQSFVPEVVSAKQHLRYSKKLRQFIRLKK